MTLLEMKTIFEMFDIKCLKDLEVIGNGEVIGNWNDLEILYVQGRIHILGTCPFMISKNDNNIIEYAFKPIAKYSVNIGIWTIQELITLLLNLQKYYPRNNESEKLSGLDYKETLSKVREQLLLNTKATLTGTEWLVQNNILRNENQYKEQELLKLINELDGLIECRTMSSAQNAYDLPMDVFIDDNKIESYLHNPLKMSETATTFHASNLDTMRIVNNESSFFECEFTRRAQIGLLFSYSFSHVQTIDSEGILNELLTFHIFYNHFNLASQSCEYYTSSISVDYDIINGKIIEIYLKDDYMQKNPGLIEKRYNEEDIKSLIIQYLKEMNKTLNEYSIVPQPSNKKILKSNK